MKIFWNNNLEHEKISLTLECALKISKYKYLKSRIFLENILYLDSSIGVV